MEDVLVDIASIDDIDKIMDVYHNRDDKDGITITKYSRDDFEFYIKQKSSGSILVAREGDEVIGFILFFDMGLWCYVEHIVVHSDKRMRGVYSRMMSVMEKISIERKWLTIEACYQVGSKIEQFANNTDWIDSEIITKWIHKNVKNNIQ